MNPTLKDRGGESATDSITDLLAIRSSGQSPRTEVWYLTATDEETRAGLWIHYELVKPEKAELYLDGWLAYFPQDGSPQLFRAQVSEVAIAGEGHGRSVVERHGQGAGGYIIHTDRFALSDKELKGEIPGARWSLTLKPQGEPLYTFPRFSWLKEVFPGSQIVPMPDARIEGTLEIEGREIPFKGVGGLARIFGHGSGHRWGWVHANPEPGVVLEIVSAVPKKAAGLIKPLAFVQLRTPNLLWPKEPLRAAAFFRSKLELPTIEISGKVGRRRLFLTATLEEGRSVRVPYTDPDGAKALCINSEVADVSFKLQKRNRTWEDELVYDLKGTGHAELGVRD